MLNNEINDKKAQEMKKENYKKYVKQKTPGQYLAHLESMNQFRNMRAPVRAFPLQDSEISYGKVSERRLTKKA